MKRLGGCGLRGLLENPLGKANHVDEFSSGAKAPLNQRAFGTTEVVPCYKACFDRRFAVAHQPAY
jgi:hypothetical protein